MDATLPQASLEDTLHVELARRIAELRANFTPAPGNKDVVMLLDSLGEHADLIRQPPMAAQEALTITQTVDSGTAVLVRLIERDPSLTRALLKAANSAYYAKRGSQCVSIADAVRQIGMQGVHNVVVGCMLEGLLCRPGASHQACVEQIWSHMVRTAPIARHLALAFDVVPETAFALGLLHDVGKLVLFDRISTLRTNLRRELRLPWYTLRQMLLRLHEPLGGIAILRWGLGESAARPIATHHRDPVPASRDLLSEIIFVAERADLAELRGERLDLEALWQSGGLSAPMERAEAGLMMVRLLKC